MSITLTLVSCTQDRTSDGKLANLQFRLRATDGTGANEERAYTLTPGEVAVDIATVIQREGQLLLRDFTQVLAGPPATESTKDAYTVAIVAGVVTVTKNPIIPPVVII